MAETASEPVDRAAVFERDGFTCQLCGEPIDMQAQHPGDWSPTLDHVIPLADGGAHAADNLQAAHFWCNSIKGDRQFPLAV